MTESDTKPTEPFANLKWVERKNLDAVAERNGFAFAHNSAHGISDYTGADGEDGWRMHVSWAPTGAINELVFFHTDNAGKRERLEGRIEKHQIEGDAAAMFAAARTFLELGGSVDRLQHVQDTAVPSADPVPSIQRAPDYPADIDHVDHAAKLAGWTITWGGPIIAPKVTLKLDRASRQINASFDGGRLDGYATYLNDEPVLIPADEPTLLDALKAILDDPIRWVNPLALESTVTGSPQVDAVLFSDYAAQRGWMLEMMTPEQYEDWFLSTLTLDRRGIDRLARFARAGDVVTVALDQRGAAMGACRELVGSPAPDYRKGSTLGQAVSFWFDAVAPKVPVEEIPDGPDDESEWTALQVRVNDVSAALGVEQPSVAYASMLSSAAVVAGQLKDPVATFATAADLFTSYWDRRRPTDGMFTAADIVTFLSFMEMARLTTDPGNADALAGLATTAAYGRMVADHERGTDQ